MYANTPQLSNFQGSQYKNAFYWLDSAGSHGKFVYSKPVYSYLIPRIRPGCTPRDFKFKFKLNILSLS